LQKPDIQEHGMEICLTLEGASHEIQKLELEEFPPKQKLRMLQNAIGEVSDLAYVKQIGDQDIS
jgi:SpoU rRNA methylase family enzyme